MSARRYEPADYGADAHARAVLHLEYERTRSMGAPRLSYAAGRWTAYIPHGMKPGCHSARYAGAWCAAQAMKVQP